MFSLPSPRKKQAPPPPALTFQARAPQNARRSDCTGPREADDDAGGRYILRGGEASGGTAGGVAGQVHERRLRIRRLRLRFFRARLTADDPAHDAGEGLPRVSRRAGVGRRRHCAWTRGFGCIEFSRGEREGKSGKKCFLVQFYFLFFPQKKKKKRSSTGAFAYDSRKRKTKT